jgi:hypothetical protein
LVAVGNDALVSNREGQIPMTVISPSILFDEIEVKRRVPHASVFRSVGILTFFRIGAI